MTTTAPVWIECSAIGCTNGIGVHWRHVDNFMDRYWCPDCESGALNSEVPC